jgi:3-hydroxyacyl-CoA dehydrogenase/enoyl-CoA hydratase/3-hydroxybutyryl-CoA epimerase
MLVQIPEATRATGQATCSSDARIPRADDQGLGTMSGCWYHDHYRIPTRGRSTVLIPDIRRRLAVAYVSEGLALLGEGFPADELEAVAMRIGMTIGPLTSADEGMLEILHGTLHHAPHGADSAPVSIPTRDQSSRNGAHLGSDTTQGHRHIDERHCGHDHDHGHDVPHWSASMQPRMAESAVYVLEKMTHGFRRLGRSAGGGFFEYPASGPKALWGGLVTFARGARMLDAIDAADRLLYAVILEAVRCAQEGLPTADIDAASLQAGLPERTGGAIRFANAQRLQTIAARSRELADRYGERFAPPPLLLAKARESAEL